MFKRLIRCHVKPSRTPTPNKDGTHNNKSNIPTKCTAWLFSTISSSSSKIITNNGTNEANKNTGTCLEDSSQKEDNCNETRNITTNFQHPNDSWRISCMPYCPDPDGIKLPFIHFTKVRNQFLAIRSLPISSSIKEQLKSHTFNNWLYSDAELINFVKFMFMDLNLPELCHFSTDILENWLFSTYSRYNNVPFHNFKHAFMVTQMMYCIIKMVNLPSFLSPVDLLILLFSALSHDLDHPGFTNSYQINAGTWLALRYNDISPLENHHCMTAFDLISNPSANIINGLTPSESRHFRKSVIRCILSTDMAIHSECISQFQGLRKQVYLKCRSSECMEYSNNSNEDMKHNHFHKNVNHPYCNSNDTPLKQQPPELTHSDPLFPSLQLITLSSPVTTQSQQSSSTSSTLLPSTHFHYLYSDDNIEEEKEVGAGQRVSKSEEYTQHNSCTDYYVNSDTSVNADNDQNNNDSNYYNNNHDQINESLIKASLISLINQQPEYLLRLLMMLLKVCDVSNEIRPPSVADPWVDCLFNEFFLQAAAEKQADLPVALHMDPDLVIKSSSQLNFLHTILIPLIKELTYIFRELNVFLESAQSRLEHFYQVRQYELAQQAMNSHGSTFETLPLSSTTIVTTAAATPFNPASVSHVIKPDVWATDSSVNCVQTPTVCSNEILLDTNKILQQQNFRECPISTPVASSSYGLHKSSIKCQQSQLPNYVVTIQSPCIRKQQPISIDSNLYNYMQRNIEK